MKISVYQSETDAYETMESIGKLKYIGETFYPGDGLSDQSIYDIIEVEGGDLLRVVDDSGEDYLYPVSRPRPFDGTSPGGKWELVEDYTGQLSTVIK